MHHQSVQPVAPKERELADPRPIKSLIGDAKTVVQQSKASAAEPAIDPNTTLLRVIGSRKQEGDGQENPPISDTLPMDERSYDLVLLADWEKDILFDPPAPTSTGLTAPNLLEPNTSLSLSNPHNLYLESNDWLQTIIWDIRRPFKDFRQLPFDPEPIPKETLPPPVKAPGKRNFTLYHNANNLTFRILQRLLDLAGVFESTSPCLRTSSTFPTINTTRSRKRNPAYDRHSANSSSNMRTLHRSFSCPS